MKRKEGYPALMWTMSAISLKKLPLPFLLMLLSEIGVGVLLGLNVFFKQNLFDQAEAVASGECFWKIAAAAVALCLFMAVQFAAGGVNIVLSDRFRVLLEQRAGEELNRKAAKVEPLCYEDNRFLDEMEKAQRGTRAAVAVFGMSVSMVLALTSYFGVMGGYLNSVQPMLLVVMLFSFIPYIAGALVRYRVQKGKEHLSAPYRRKAEYYAGCITDREYAKETRMLGAYGYFFQKVKENLEIVRELDWKAAKKTTRIEVLLRFLAMSGYVVTVVLLFYYLLTGRVRVGAFAAIAASLDGMYDKLEGMFRFRIGGMTAQLGMAENYLAFLGLPQREGELAFPEGRTAEFREVSFAYPNASGNALSCVDFTLREKETVAIVGKNGAGKSTFARLLLGIYCPTQGQVLIDGVDTRQVRHDADAGCSAVFQRFQKYKMTVADNVVLGSSRDEPDESRIGEALEKADLPLTQRTFREGTETLLAKEFGGTDLSGGQWQRLAVARGLYRRHNLIVLDEPTSAIDPLEETRVYEKFAELSRDKTAVIITHRLGSAKIADRIIVMDEGVIVETGTHEELMEKKGLYFEMYRAQAKWYV